jgi:hypothetical protein
MGDFLSKRPLFILFAIGAFASILVGLLKFQLWLVGAILVCWAIGLIVVLASRRFKWAPWSLAMVLFWFAPALGNYYLMPRATWQIIDILNAVVFLAHGLLFIKSPSPESSRARTVPVSQPAFGAPQPQARATPPTPIVRTPPVAQRAQTPEDPSGIRVFHFTQAQNLKNIFQHGLLSRTELEKRRIKYQANDSNRWDKSALPAANVCTSVGFPNYKMLHTVRNKGNGPFVVLELHAEILKEHTFLVSPTNLAFGLMTKAIDRFGKKPFEGQVALKETFAENDFFREGENSFAMRRSERGLRNGYTNDPQAEVVFAKPIEPSWIASIHVETSADQSRLQQLGLGKLDFEKIRVSPEFFRQRTDHEYWPQGRNADVDAFLRRRGFVK